VFIVASVSVFGRRLSSHSRAPQPDDEQMVSMQAGMGIEADQNR